MGCGINKVLPEASMSVVQSLVAFSKARGDDDELKKCAEKHGGPWFSTGVKNLEPVRSSRQPMRMDGRQQDKVSRYKDKFDPRVTAR